MIAVDQYRNVYPVDPRRPRASLCERLGYRSARRMFVDRDGRSLHVGYVIGGQWLTLYCQFEGRA